MLCIFLFLVLRLPVLFLGVAGTAPTCPLSAQRARTVSFCLRLRAQTAHCLPNLITGRGYQLVLEISSLGYHAQRAENDIASCLLHSRRKNRIVILLRSAGPIA